MPILALAESRDGILRPSARETVSAAAALADALGTTAEAVTFGAGDAAAGLGAFGAAKVHAGEGDTIAQQTAALAALLQTGDHAALLLPGSVAGKELGPRLAARLGVGYAAECTGLEAEGGAVVAIRPRYAGKVVARESFGGKPVVVTLRANAFPVRETGGSAEVVPLEVPAAGDTGVTVRETREAAATRLDVSEARVVVSGGRGLQDPANFQMLEELAAALGNAAVGASRAVVDAGWRPHAEQVGQTGKTVAPQLYFAIGISGAMQHLAGMRTARFIVAINKDADAPIFKVADYGLVGDLFQIVPQLVEEVKRVRG